MDTTGFPRKDRTMDSGEVLFDELERLKSLLNLGHDLTLSWLPSKDRRLRGEVREDCICLYDEDVNSALMTLRHEFLDYAICQAIEPYKKVTNKLIELLNEEAYLRKEKLVDILARII
jgi:hypothetical protein